MRTREQPWGLSGLSLSLRRKVEQSNAMLMAALLIIEAIVTSGGSGTIEHPADPKRPPFPSIFALPVMMEMESRIGARRWTFTQCMWGCPAQKLTTITGVADPEAMDEFVARWCNHATHAASLCGTDENGHFRTRLAQAYPQPMCRQLALAHVRWMRKREPRAGSTELASKLVLQGIAQYRASREAALPPAAPLPASFLQASG